MKELISSEYYKFLFKDTCEDEILLLDFAAVFELSNVKVRLHVYKPNYIAQLEKIGCILSYIQFDDPFTVMEANNSLLSEIVKLHKRTTRYHLNSKTFINLKKKLVYDFF